MTPKSARIKTTEQMLSAISTNLIELLSLTRRRTRKKMNGLNSERKDENRFRLRSANLELKCTIIVLVKFDLLYQIRSYSLIQSNKTIIEN